MARQQQGQRSRAEKEHSCFPAEFRTHVRFSRAVTLLKY
jgi:hypothetical protein